jgi:hypothetical protein
MRNPWKSCRARCLLGKAEPLATITMLNSRVRALGIMESQLTQMDAAMATALGLPATPDVLAVSIPASAASAASPAAPASAH